MLRNTYGSVWIVRISGARSGEHEPNWNVSGGLSGAILGWHPTALASARARRARLTRSGVISLIVSSKSGHSGGSQRQIARAPTPSCRGMILCRHPQSAGHSIAVALLGLCSRQSARKARYCDPKVASQVLGSADSPRMDSRTSQGLAGAFSGILGSGLARVGCRFEILQFSVDWIITLAVADFHIRVIIRIGLEVGHEHYGGDAQKSCSEDFRNSEPEFFQPGFDRLWIVGWIQADDVRGTY